MPYQTLCCLVIEACKRDGLVVGVWCQSVCEVKSLEVGGGSGQKGIAVHLNLGDRFGLCLQVVVQPFIV